MTADLTSAFRHAPIGVALATVDGVLTEVNAALTELLGHAAGHMRGRPLLAMTHPDDVPGARDACRGLARSRSRRWLHECRLVHRDGHAVPVQVTSSWVDSGTADPHLVMLVEDISERSARETELRRRSLHDPLTGVGNRRKFSERLMHALRHGQQELTPTCLVVVDVNAFKMINDRYGHQVGDLVLVAVAERLTSTARHSDEVVRLGGDEFGIVCGDTTTQEAAVLVRRLRRAMAAPLLVGDAELMVRVSVGVGVSEPGNDPDVAVVAIMAQADKAMYANKSSAAHWG
ncbi:Diguanylate cyclase with PAS/PAC sensor [Modestobacter italicus]|uniref:Diguanylate cyclase with PAS/PAC sensor n=1 Tax=Modestobacter italicus (strain DSM 44449 / CECT 9708 / BC 501) TaxID=2732864 RepID=I4F0S5_MODI5|nr:GGDEF domain-containing protein [Modestobacter marinus]CCH89238.1 Diguanylate cyclase with PAS/PAC sensor [Modestobacter marinus]